MSKCQLVIFSGGPGSGKTTLLENLKTRGFVTFAEVPRLLIEKNLKENKDLLPWVDLPAFAGQCHREMLKQKRHNTPIAFLDRAIGDIIAYLHIGGYGGDEYLKDAIEGYYQTVFLLKPHESIYIQDAVRPHTFKEALDIHNEIAKVYESLGYSLVLIPFGASDMQADMVLNLMNL